MRIFLFLCVPLACWQVWIFPSIPSYHLQHFFVYPVVAFMLWLLVTRALSLRAVISRWIRYAPLAVLILCLQVFALWNYSQPDAVSAVELSTFARLRRMGVLLAKIILQWPFIILFAELCRFIVQNADRRRVCMVGYLAASIFLIILCTIQGLYIYTVDTQSPVLTLVHSTCQTVLRTVSPYLEARWLDSVYDFYAQGAYSITIQRINGLFEEASSLSAWIATFFLPLSIGFLALQGRNCRRIMLMGWTGCIAWIFILFLLRGTTGQLLGITALVLLFVGSGLGQRKLLPTMLVSVCAGLCLCIALFVPQVSTFLQARMQLDRIAHLPRVIIMLDTLDIIKKHPFTGVGRGNFTPHIVQGKRYTQNLAHDPELQGWKKNNSVPPLSALLGFTAQYGIPLLLLLLGGIAHLWLQVYRRWRTQPANPLLRYTLAAFTAWCVLAFIASIGSLDWRNPLFCLPLFSFMAIAQQADITPEGPTNAT